MSLFPNFKYTYILTGFCILFYQHQQPTILLLFKSTRYEFLNCSTSQQMYYISINLNLCCSVVFTLKNFSPLHFGEYIQLLFLNQIWSQSNQSASYVILLIFFVLSHIFKLISKVMRYPSAKVTCCSLASASGDFMIILYALTIATYQLSYFYSLLLINLTMCAFPWREISFTTRLFIPLNTDLIKGDKV